MQIPVLYISYDGMTDPLGQSQVIPYLIGLTNNGYSFTLLSCEKPDNFSKHKNLIHSILKENNIDWKPISYTKTPAVLSTIYDVLRLKKAAEKLHQKNKYAIVHCRSYIASLAGLHLKKKYGIKFIFDMRGLWADERVDGKLWNLKNPLYKLVFTYFKKKEKEFLCAADYTISLTHNAKKEILTWKNIDVNNLKIKVIPCCVDMELFNSKTIKSETISILKTELKISKDDFVLLYLGSIGTWYMLDEMMGFFSILKKSKPNAKFLFVSKDEHKRILESSEKYDVEDDIIIRSAERKEIPDYISICNYSIFFILPSYSKKASSPTKQGEIMAMGIPVICNTNVGDTDKIVSDYNSGILVENLLETDFENAIRKMNVSFDKCSIVNGAVEYFSLESGIIKYNSVYESVLH